MLPTWSEADNSYGLRHLGELNYFLYNALYYLLIANKKITSITKCRNSIHRSIYSSFYPSTHPSNLSKEKRQEVMVSDSLTLTRISGLVSFPQSSRKAVTCIAISLAITGIFLKIYFRRQDGWRCDIKSTGSKKFFQRHFVLQLQITWFSPVFGVPIIHGSNF